MRSLISAKCWERRSKDVEGEGNSGHSGNRGIWGSDLTTKPGKNPRSLPRKGQQKYSAGPSWLQICGRGLYLKKTKQKNFSFLFFFFLFFSRTADLTLALRKSEWMRIETTEGSRAPLLLLVAANSDRRRDSHLVTKNWAVFGSVVMSALLCLIAGFVSLYVLVYYCVFRSARCSSSVKLKGKTAIVTGNTPHCPLISSTVNTVTNSRKLRNLTIVQSGPSLLLVWVKVSSDTWKIAKSF